MTRRSSAGSEQPTSNRQVAGSNPAVEAMAKLGAVMIVIGMIVGIAYPSKITGAILPIGLVVFWAAGLMARGMDKR
jgi:hypothetical protein